MTERHIPNHDQEPNPKEAALAKFEGLLADKEWRDHPNGRIRHRSTGIFYKGKQNAPYDYAQVTEEIRKVRPSRISTRMKEQRFLRISEYDGIDSEMRHVTLATHCIYDYQTGYLKFNQHVAPDDYLSAREVRKFIEEQPELYPSYQIGEEGDNEDNEHLWEYLNSLADSLAAHSKYTAEANAELQRAMRESREWAIPGEHIPFLEEAIRSNTPAAISKKEMEPKPELANLPAELGFKESEELARIKQHMLDSFSQGYTEEVSSYLELFQLMGQFEIDIIEDDTETYTKAQIGFIVAQANIYYEAGQFGLYRSQLNDALTYADNMRFDEVAARIQAALDNMPKTEEDQLTSEVTSSELALALADTLPEETCQAISEMDLAYALAFALGELGKVGVEEPAALLVEKGILVKYER